MSVDAAIAAIILSSNLATAPQFPIHDAEAAIAIGKALCAGKADPSAPWHADLDVTGRFWAAQTVFQHSGDKLWGVTIPVNGPMPTVCDFIHYNILPSRSN